MYRSALTLLAAATVAAIATPAPAQPAPPSAGAPVIAAPTTAPRATLVVPPGFDRVTVGGYTALCEPNDQAWVKRALADVKPATRPTTMPADVLQRIATNRAAVIKQIVTDFALSGDKELNAFFDDMLVPTMKKLDTVKPPVFFLVCTRDRLRDITKAGWGEPRYHYNRVANEASYDDNVMLTIDRPMDDAVLPALYVETDPPETRAKNLSAGVQQLDAHLALQLSQQCQPAVFNMLADHIDKTVFVPLKLRRDQKWLELGVTGYFTAAYAGTLTPAPKDLWLKQMTFDSPRFPVSAKPIDLARPLEESAMRAVAVPYYNQAMRRKAVAVVMTWAQKGGDASVTKVLTAVRAKPPADGPALIKLIQDTAGVDLSKDVAPQ